MPSNFPNRKFLGPQLFRDFHVPSAENTVAKTTATLNSWADPEGPTETTFTEETTLMTPVTPQVGFWGWRGISGTGCLATHLPNDTTVWGGIFREDLPPTWWKIQFLFWGGFGGQLIRGVLLARSPKPQKANLWWNFLKVAGATLSNIHNFCDIPNWLVNSINHPSVFSQLIGTFSEFEQAPQIGWTTISGVYFGGCNVALSCRTCRWNPPAKHLIRRPFLSRHGGLKEGAVLQKSGPTDLGWHLFLGFYLCQLWVLCLVFVAAVGDTLPRAQWVKGHGDSFLRKVGCFWENIWIPV